MAAFEAASVDVVLGVRTDSHASNIPAFSAQFPGSCWGRMKESAANSPRRCRWWGGSHFTSVAAVRRLGGGGGAGDSSETSVGLETHLRV